MNLYLRYFDSEILVTKVDDAIAFLAGIQEIGMNNRIADDVRAYFNSDNHFPKRYKVRPKIYFIMIKTDANNMQEFKDYRDRSITKANEEPAHVTDSVLEKEPTPEYNQPAPQPQMLQMPPRRERQANVAVIALHTERFGWYEGTFQFKRVVTVPSTGKNEYRDTRFVARCKAMSGIDCYNRITEYLHGCVDSRSQFPSAKGKNFSFSYLGECKPFPEDDVEEMDD